LGNPLVPCRDDSAHYLGSLYFVGIYSDEVTNFFTFPRLKHTQFSHHSGIRIREWHQHTLSIPLINKNNTRLSQTFRNEAEPQQLGHTDNIAALKRRLESVKKFVTSSE